MADIDDFLASVGKSTPRAEQPQVACGGDRITQPRSSHFIPGGVGTGKPARGYWLLERFSALYNLAPATAGIPPNKREKVPA